MNNLSLKTKAAVVEFIAGFISTDEEESLFESSLKNNNYFGCGSYESLISNLDSDEIAFVPEFEEYKSIISELGFEEIIDDSAIILGRDVLIDYAEGSGDIMIEYQEDGSIEAYRNSTGEVYQ